MKIVSEYSIDLSLFGFQGGGTTISIGAGEINVTVNSLTLLQGRTSKGTMFGGVRTQSDLPIIIQKCMNKVTLKQLLNKYFSL